MKGLTDGREAEAEESALFCSISYERESEHLLLLKIESRSINSSAINRSAVLLPI